jgi:hypothetical protein
LPDFTAFSAFYNGQLFHQNVLQWLAQSLYKYVVDKSTAIKSFSGRAKRYKIFQWPGQPL